MYPFVTSAYPQMVRPFRVLRHQAVVVNNVTSKGLRVMGTFSGAICEKAVQVGDSAGGASLVDVTNEIFFEPAARGITETDELLDSQTDTRYRVLRVFRYPAKTVVWCAASTAPGAK